MLNFVVQAHKKSYVAHIDLRQTIFPMSIFVPQNSNFSWKYLGNFHGLSIAYVLERKWLLPNLTLSSL